METTLLWQTSAGQLLARGERQLPPFDSEQGAELFALTHDFNLVNPADGAVLQTFRRSYERFDQKDAYYLTGHLVQEEILYVLHFRLQLPGEHDGRQRQELQRTPLLQGLTPCRGIRWRTAEGQILEQGAPQTTTYGRYPVCELLSELFDYTLLEPSGETVLQCFHRADQLQGYGDNEKLTRYRVEGNELVRYIFDYTEDSCYAVGHVRGHQRQVQLRGLTPLRPK